MKTRTERTYIELKVEKSMIDNFDGVYFHEQGIRMEDIVVEFEVENAVNATFDGFEVIPGTTQEHWEKEPMITAKLYYYVDVKID